ncbi:hypothetical protein LWI29_021167 [Acer saccharum]|uniref:Thioredoxin domain-containing protein n=2 Tax=Acer TaxID=4022 RepID=A0A5C7H611_9ROSI|nr:hypothetical protein LWI29_021167 [Acer saccharum]TXG52159.1 hypothetical protein EZV62_021328 [Acer yangbiense]
MAEEVKVISCHTVDAWKEQIQKGIDSKKLIVVDFTATWCPPCRMMAPFFEELAKKMTDVIFLKVDVDELKTVAEECDVQAMPTFMYFQEGKVVDKLVGANKPRLQELAEKHATAIAAA